MSRHVANRTSPPGSRRPRTGARAGTVLVAALGLSLLVAGTPGADARAATPGTGSSVLTVDDDLTPNRVTWSVQPTVGDDGVIRPNFVYDADPGDVVQDSIRVRNFGKKDLELRIYAADARNTETGVVDLLPAGERSRDVGDWVKLEDSELTIAPDKFVDVPFTMTVPEKAESGDHVGGIVTSLLTTGTESGQPVRVDHRLGSRVQVRVAGPLSPALTVTGMTTNYSGSVNPAGRGDINVTYTVENTGNVRLAAQQFLKAKGLFGLVNRSATLNPMPELLPGNSIRITTAVSGVWPTIRSSANLEIRPIPTRPGDEFPALKSARAGSSTWSVPWSLLLVLLAAGSFAAGTILLRRRAAQQEQLRVDAAVAAKLQEHGGTPEPVLAAVAPREQVRVSEGLFDPNVAPNTPPWQDLTSTQELAPAPLTPPAPEPPSPARSVGPQRPERPV